jgi:hypothetical protein
MKAGIVQKKKYKTDYETENGSLCIPILGDLFPNLWGQKLNPVDKWILVIDNTEYCIDKESYDNISEGDMVEIGYNGNLPEIKLSGKI